MQLNIDKRQAVKARDLASRISSDLMGMITTHTTTSVERAYLRLLGLDGTDENEIPLPNVLVRHLHEAGGLGLGACYRVANAIYNHNLDLNEIALRVAAGDLSLMDGKQNPPDRVIHVLDEMVASGMDKINRKREERKILQEEMGMGKEPLLYIIVATGDIYADAGQARAGVMQGADIVAVIRHTAQSLLDFVPYSATTGGVGGTYATGENFRIMRSAVDDAAREAGRYVMLTNYCSGLCMPEIAVLGAFERLDVMLNDSMYGIIFRDINMRRTFIDQYVSRMINGYAGVIINTGEDNYLTTADAFEAAHTVVASQFINERFAFESGLPEEQMGLGHAFEINPRTKDSLLYEIAQAQLVRQLFPKAPIKYMPPTKYMTGNIFMGHVQNSMFNLASVLTGQSIHLLGMLTEAIHTPHLQDRYLAIENAKYVFDAAADLAGELAVRPGGRIEKRAQQVLDEAVSMLEEISEIGLMEAIACGMFAEIKRKPDGGKGMDGVVAMDDEYLSPFMDILKKGYSQAGSRERSGISLEIKKSNENESADTIQDCRGLSMDHTRVIPYGDTPGDGATQISFTLPVPAGDEAKEAARQLACNMGFAEPSVVHMKDLGDGFTYFIVYGRCTASVDYTAVNVPKVEFPRLGAEQVSREIRELLGRPLKVVGACIESDAHTVGIDAIMNMKGYDGHKGLESYSGMEAINLGAQVSCEDLLAHVIDIGADVLLVSQVVTQRDVHVRNLTRLVDMLEAEGLREKIILVVGGPRISQELAKELGYDAGFGPGTFPDDVASYLVYRIRSKLSGNE